MPSVAWSPSLGIDAPIVASEESGSEREDVLDVLIAYHRAELDGYQRRIERADTRAAGVITIAFGLSGLAATSFAALDRALGAVEIVVLAVGGLCVLASVLMAFISRDSRFRRQYLGLRILRRVARRVNVTVPLGGLPLSISAAGWFDELENAEDKLSKPSDMEWSEGASDGVAVREAVAQSLRTRVRASFTVALWSEQSSRRAALLLCGGVCVIAVAFVLTLVSG
jgi:hypothetical protein